MTKPTHLGQRGPHREHRHCIFVRPRVFAQERHGICKWCGKAVTQTVRDLPFGGCCGEPTGLWDRSYPSPWKTAR